MMHVLGLCKQVSCIANVLEHTGKCDSTLLNISPFMMKYCTKRTVLQIIQ